ncbi:hypothetical protein BLNAU_3771 [Blattamonas nauphoetae]|uniref:Uncharacterized protein n=1 Tax=Blattamonas nauphoetae TaxID=2049346 RepID=A0ABQ9YCA7_9EUKA|nr:hypothetical protein BLNAU_3771 [Blattamonas nauphoetae]
MTNPYPNWRDVMDPRLAPPRSPQQQPHSFFGGIGVETPTTNVTPTAYGMPFIQQAPGPVQVRPAQQVYSSVDTPVRQTMIDSRRTVRFEEPLPEFTNFTATVPHLTPDENPFIPSPPVTAAVSKQKRPKSSTISQKTPNNDPNQIDPLLRSAFRPSLLTSPNRPRTTQDTRSDGSIASSPRQPDTVTLPTPIFGTHLSSLKSTRTADETRRLTKKAKGFILHRMSKIDQNDSKPVRTFISDGATFLDDVTQKIHESWQRDLLQRDHRQRDPQHEHPDAPIFNFVLKVVNEDLERMHKELVESSVTTSLIRSCRKDVSNFRNDAYAIHSRVHHHQDVCRQLKEELQMSDKDFERITAIKD